MEPLLTLTEMLALFGAMIYIRTTSRLHLAKLNLVKLFEKICGMKSYASTNTSSHFWLPLSRVAFLQLEELKDLLLSIPRDVNMHDEWTYIWGTTDFSSKKDYTHLIGSLPTSPLFKWMWKSKVLPKHKFFFEID
jgi:hypothetical protein